MSSDPNNEREKDKNEAEILNNLQLPNRYAAEMLGNTEVDVDIQGNMNSSPRQRVNQQLNMTEPLNLSQNSPRPNNDTNVPQNMITSFANENNEMRFNRLSLNTELDRLPTERGNELLNSGMFLNNSNTNLLNNTLEKKASNIPVSPTPFLSHLVIVKNKRGKAKLIRVFRKEQDSCL